MQLVEMIQLSEAVNDPDQYNLNDVIDSYSSDDISGIWTPRSNDGEPSVVPADSFIGKPIEGFQEINIATWIGDRLFNDTRLPSIMVNGKWYVMVNEDDTPEWM